MNGYGLTETAPVVTVNTPTYKKRGSVGKPLPGVEVRIANDGSNAEGEILTRGQHVTKGYYLNPKLTAEVIDSDGWFHTGDYGYLDKDGFLFITGRKKALIVLSSGKKIHPEELELAIEQNPLVKMSCVVGLKTSSGNDMVVAVVMPTDLSADQQLITSSVESSLQPVATYKRPNKILIRTEAFPMTTTLKIKRDELAKELRQKLNAEASQ